MKFLDSYKKSYAAKKKEVLSFEDYLKAAQADPSFYSSAAERMLKAIGEPEVIDTSKDPRLSRIHGNRIIYQYKVFAEFYGIDHVIEQVVAYFRHAAQGLEEKNQILYLKGPPGSAKSTLAECLKNLMEQNPIYILAYTGPDSLNGHVEESPVNESPLGLLSVSAAEELGINPRYLKTRPSGWAVKRLGSAKGDLTHFKVVKTYPSFIEQRAIAVVVASDENNQDISTLVGKGSIRKIEKYEQNDPDCYSYSGGLCTGNQGLVEMAEMHKSKADTLNPLLTATQEHYYEPTEKIGVLPFDGIVLGHSNISDWDNYKADPANVAIIDRTYMVEVPYCTRVSEEVKIYQKFLKTSTLANAPCAPKTLELLAAFCVLSRLDPVSQVGPDGTELRLPSFNKMRVYDGENLKDQDITAKPLQTYKDLATRDEGFSGISTRDAFQILSKVYNFDVDEVGANPVHLFTTLNEYIVQERVDETNALTYKNIIRDTLEPEYFKVAQKDIQRAFVGQYDEWGQATFDHYLIWADHWIDDNDYRDPDTGQLFNRQVLDDKLSAIEKPLGIGNPKDFRNEVRTFALKYQAFNKGKKLNWKEFPKIRKVIEANVLEKMEELLPVISFGSHKSKEDEQKHKDFVARMMEPKEDGSRYRERDVQVVVNWVQNRKNQ